MLKMNTTEIAKGLSCSVSHARRLAKTILAKNTVKSEGRIYVDAMTVKEFAQRNLYLYPNQIFGHTPTGENCKVSEYQERAWDMWNKGVNAVI